MRIITTTLSLLMLFITFSSKAQDFSNDIDFFNQKSIEYQRWLDTKGIGQVLRVDRVQFMKNANTNELNYSELELILTINSTSIDTAVSLWNQLKLDFDNPSDSLEDYLFRMFIHKMEIPNKNGNIQIYTKNKLGRYNPCFYVWIWSEEGDIFTEEKVAPCKSKSFTITIPPFNIDSSSQKKSNKLVIDNINSDLVFDEISHYLQKNIIKNIKYTQDLSDRKPCMENPIRNENSFKLTLANLGREVLTDQYRSWWESFININTIAMERLYFEFEFFPLKDGSFMLSCVIHGKYGSGVFKPRVSGYMDMEPDFDDFFEQYKNNFRAAILEHLMAINEK